MNTPLPLGLLEQLAPTFLRGSVASAIVAAVQDQHRGAQLLQTALLGGTALSSAVALENLIFKPESKMTKKKKGGKNKDARIDLAALQALLQQKPGAPAGTLGTLGNLTPGQQLLLGVLIGAAAAWVLGDEALRAKLLRVFMQLYSGAAGGLEEIKEQVADIQAELEAQRMSGA